MRNKVCITTTTTLVPQADQFRISVVRVSNSKHKAFSSKTLPAAQHSTQNSARNKRQSAHQAEYEAPSAPKHLHKPSKKHQWDKSNHWQELSSKVVLERACGCIAPDYYQEPLHHCEISARRHTILAPKELVLTTSLLLRSSSHSSCPTR